jgi:hypothetical protein
MAINICILRNEAPDSGDNWLHACENRGLKADVIDLCTVDAIDRVAEGKYDLCLTWPPGLLEAQKSIYDEKLYHIANVLKIPCFPSFQECFIYENKKSAAAYFQASGIPHPKTWVFCYYKDAEVFANKCTFPIVAKTAIGAAGTGVKILKNRRELITYIRAAFKGKGIKRRFGPNRNTGSPKKWLTKAINSPGYLKFKIKQYLAINHYAQAGYVIFQEYIEHNYEWRVVRIGDSFFAHKKIKVADKASGGKVKEFGFPPYAVLDFVEGLCDKHDLNCVCIDLFESPRGYLVNEAQCVFGIPYKYLSKVEDDVGRFRKIEGEWTFEKGDFTKNEACDLKLEVALRLFSEKSTSSIN